MSEITTTRSKPPESGPRPDAVRIRFIEGRSGILSLLEVDAPASVDVGDRLRRALFALRVQVVSHERQQSVDRTVHWLKVVEFDGAQIAESRRKRLKDILASSFEQMLSPLQSRI